MKRMLAVMVITLALPLGVPSYIAASETAKPVEIPWLTSLEGALQLAKQQGKPVLLDFYNPK